MNTATSQSSNSIDDTATYLGKPRSQMSPVEHKIEDRLDDTRQVIRMLKDQAEQMNREIEDQNVVIGRATGKVEALQDATKGQNKQMRNIVR